MTNDPDTMDTGAYLARGGRLSSPENVASRYRGELLRLMSSFVDSELAGSAGFAATINMAPGIKARIAASRITLEKADHAERVLDLMEAFGTDKVLYEKAHNWAARVNRESSLEAKRHGGDMRLSVFHYPLTGWTDAVVMNVLMGLATVHSLKELSHCSYQPLAEVLHDILPCEQRHMALGLEALEQIATDAIEQTVARASVAYWMPRVAETFGPAQSDRFARLCEMGLRRTDNETLRQAWRADAETRLAALKLI
ncbi:MULTISPECIES: Phenylacetic acid catabolic protein [Roseobacteraceae]|uniref:Phenylacetic acid catabolic n=1 Tax=Celeribacter baekdonensis TaxID=875171 RepID=A0A2R4M913_9RHOB|nr:MULTISPECIES: Phenylacetic acid catabolic protein [Roseobacteraceae]AVW93695.1 phenylacetic acid catabolic [Celeribacter baekdonensis]KAB6714601.1 phenylacetic acid catabolic [Roseobacter sp. TSBP12]